MHFGYDPDEPKIRSGEYLLHIPIRHPLEVAKSWARRDKKVAGLIEAYESMFEHMELREHKLYLMEGLPKLDGHLEYPDKEAAPWQIDKYEHQVLVNVISPHMEFFEHYYG